MSISFDLLGKLSLRVWAAILWKIEGVFKLALCHCFRPNPCTRMCVSTIGSFSLFRKKQKYWYKVRRILFFGFFLIWDFSVYFDYLSRITLWGWGTPSPPGPHGGDSGGPSAGGPPGIIWMIGWDCRSSPMYNGINSYSPQQGTIDKAI